MPQNSNYSNNKQLKVGFSLRLSESLLAMLLTAGFSFGGGFMFNSSQKQTSVCQLQTDAAHNTFSRVTE